MERILLFGVEVLIPVFVLNNATPEEVKVHVRERMEIFSPGGGFVFNPIHNILHDVPPQNIIAMFEAVNEFNTK